MKRSAEFATCAAIAVAAHLSLILAFPKADGAAASGNGGDAAISLAAAPEMIAALVAEWETPPDVQTAPEPLTPPVTPITTPPPPVATPVMPLTAMPELPSVPELTALPTDLAPPPEKTPELEVIEDTPPAPSPAPERRPEIAQPKPTPKAEPEPVRKAAAPKPQAEAKPKGKDQVSSQGRAAQTAAGSGGGQAAGRDGSEQVSSGLSKGQANDMKRWQAAMQARIERAKREPRAERGQKGRVIIEFVVRGDGTLVSAKVIKSSGIAAFDDAALRAVRDARLPAAPKSLNIQTQKGRVPLDFII